MVEKYEYCYLFGLDIPLEQYNLGVIKQPKLIDLINKDKDLQDVYIPFLMNDYAIENSKDKIELSKLIKEVGSLTFFITMSYQMKRVEMINSLIDSLKFLYQTDNVNLGSKNITIDNHIVIDDSNFDTLTNVILEMFKIDKSKIDFKSKEEDLYAGLSEEMIIAKKKYLERVGKSKKKEGISFVDIVNIIIHSNNTIDYNSVLNMTIFQIKNTFEIINAKESYEFNKLVRISPKFDTSKEKHEHWTEKIKLDKSILSQ